MFPLYYFVSLPKFTQTLFDIFVLWVINSTWRKASQGGGTAQSLAATNCFGISIWAMNFQKTVDTKKRINWVTFKKCILDECGLTPSYLLSPLWASYCSCTAPSVWWSSCMQHIHLQYMKIHMPRYAGTICHAQPDTHAHTCTDIRRRSRPCAFRFLYNWKSCLCQTEVA